MVVLSSYDITSAFGLMIALAGKYLPSQRSSFLARPWRGVLFNSSTTVNSVELPITNNPAAKITLLDGVRGLAGLLVFRHHYMGEVSNNGPFGVDMFFMLSSLLLTSGFYKKLLIIQNKGALRSLKSVHLCAEYIVRRFFRVYPFYFIVVVASCYVLPKFGVMVWWTWINPQEMIMMLTLDLKNIDNTSWSLLVEIQYYAFIPGYCFLSMLARRYYLPVQVLVLCLMIYPAMHTYRLHHQELDHHYTTFVIGSAFGVLWHHLKAFPKIKNPILVFWLDVAGYATVLIILSQVNGGFLYSWNLLDPALLKGDPEYPFTNIFVGGLILKELLVPSITTSVMSWSVFTYAGKVCFPLYLLHAGAVNYFRYVESNERSSNSITCVLIASTLGHYIFEEKIELAANWFCLKLKELMIVDEIQYKPLEVRVSDSE